MIERLVIGVDGGGTRTRAALADDSGQLLGMGASGSGNYHDVGLERVRAHIDVALDQAFAEAQRGRCSVDAAFFGMASVVSEEDRSVIRDLAAALDIAPVEGIEVDHDLRIAQAGGHAGAAGIVLIVGTGSSCFGRAADGRSWRAGGWGSRLDDGGSAAYLGIQALVAAVRDFDDRGERTALRGRVLDTLGLSDMQQMMYRVDGTGLSRSDVAGLARVVTRAAEEGDGVARRIIERGAEELALMVQAVARNVDVRDDAGVIPVTLTGGLLRAGTVIADPVKHAIRAAVPDVSPVPRRLPPVLGAVLLAIDALRGGVNDGIVGELMRAWSSREVSAAEVGGGAT